MIEATLRVQIEHVRGEWINLADHVLAWVVADGSRFAGLTNGFEFLVCPRHPDPDACEHEDAAMSLYRCEIGAVARAEREPAQPLPAILDDALARFKKKDD